MRQCRFWGIISHEVRHDLTHIRLVPPLTCSRSLKSEAPDVLISTPTKLLVLLEAKTIDLSHLRFLAIDEADLLLSYGHKDDLTRLMDPSTGWMPKLGVQGCLMSATLSEDVEGVKGLVLRNPVCCPMSRCGPPILMMGRRS